MFKSSLATDCTNIFKTLELDGSSCILSGFKMLSFKMLTS